MHAYTYSQIEQSTIYATNYLCTTMLPNISLDKKFSSSWFVEESILLSKSQSQTWMNGATWPGLNMAIGRKGFNLLKKKKKNAKWLQISSIIMNMVMDLFCVMASTCQENLAYL